jgi:hypothetical protein
MENVEYSARERSISAVKGAYSSRNWTRRREGKPVRSIAAQALIVPPYCSRDPHIGFGTRICGQIGATHIDQVVRRESKFMQTFGL